MKNNETKSFFRKLWFLYFICNNGYKYSNLFLVLFLQLKYIANLIYSTLSLKLNHRIFDAQLAQWLLKRFTYHCFYQYSRYKGKTNNSYLRFSFVEVYINFCIFCSKMLLVITSLFSMNLSLKMRYYGKNVILISKLKLERN